MSYNNSPLTPTFTPFKSGCGMCKPSTDYYNVQTGSGNYSKDGLIPDSNGKNFYQEKNFQLPMDSKFLKENFGIDYATSFGGKKSKTKKILKKSSIKKPSSKKLLSSKKTKKSLKGGYDDISSENVQLTNSNLIEDEMSGGSKKNNKKSQKGGNPMSNSNHQVPTHPSHPVAVHKVLHEMSGGIKKNNRKLQKGGSSAASVNPSLGPSPVQTHQVKVNNLSYLTTKQINHQISGGTKKNKISKKGGSAPFSLDLVNSMPFVIKNSVSGGKKNKRNMKGGQESSGATPMDQRFYDPQATLQNYPPNSGNGVMSAYGPIQVGDVGSGMLAPYTTSNCSTANPNTTMKTGGSKKNKKNNLKGAGGPIPKISDASVSRIQGAVTGAINKFSNFMQELDQDYEKSIDYIKSIKIGNQRLIQGGKKTSSKKSSKLSSKKSSKLSSKKSSKLSSKKSIKTSSKKSTKPSSKKLKKGGFDGSDFALTLNSRGPSNAPDDYWGVPGETWFRQFNKTGDYIPNSQLPYAATPLLAGTNPSGVVTGYDEADLNYIQM